MIRGPRAASIQTASQAAQSSVNIIVSKDSYNALEMAIAMSTHLLPSLDEPGIWQKLRTASVDCTHHCDVHNKLLHTFTILMGNQLQPWSDESYFACLLELYT